MENLKMKATSNTSMMEAIVYTKLKFKIKIETRKLEIYRNKKIQLPMENRKVLCLEMQ